MDEFQGRFDSRDDEIGVFYLAIRAGTLPDSALIARKLAPLHNVMCAAPSYIEAHGKPRVPTDLLDHNCLHYAYSSDVHEWTFLGAEGPIKVQTAGNFQVNNSEALLEALIGGAGISRLPTFVAGRHIASGKLVRLLKQYQMPLQTIYAVFPERRHLPIKVRVFVEFLVERFRQDRPYWDDFET